MIKTYKNGYIKTKDVLKQKYNKISNYDKIGSIYKLKKNKIAKDIPFESLYVTGGHSILVDEISIDEMNEQQKIWIETEKIEDKYLLLSCVNKLFERKYCNNNNEYIYHILLENDDIYKHYGIYINGILSESISEYMFNKYAK